MGDQIIDEKDEEIKPWDNFFQTSPPEFEGEEIPANYSLLFDGRRLEAGLIAASAELVSDLLWGNLALPIDKCLEKLRRIDQICAGAPADEDYLAAMKTRMEVNAVTKSVTDRPSTAPSTLTDEQIMEERLLRRECREMLELSTQQLEEMSEKKGEFGNEYRVVTAGWYMMMLPSTTLRSPLVAPDDASKAAWEWMEFEYERRRVEGDRWRTAREDETLFDEELARTHPYELMQTRRRYEMTITIPVPAKTRACDVRIKIEKRRLKVTVSGHPLLSVIDGELFLPVHVSGSGGEWHVEGEFETRRVVLDLDKEKLGPWPCLMKADAPDTPERPRVVVSGANGDVDVYAEVSSEILHKPQPSDKYFCWGDAPSAPSAGAKSVRALKPSKGGGLPPTVEEAERLNTLAKAKLAEADATEAAAPAAEPVPVG